MLRLQLLEFLSRTAPQLAARCRLQRTRRHQAINTLTSLADFLVSGLAHSLALGLKKAVRLSVERAEAHAADQRVTACAVHLSARRYMIVSIPFPEKAQGGNASA